MPCSYFKLGNTFFRKLIGIPMVADPPLVMDNLSLYFHENKWVGKIKIADVN